MDATVTRAADAGETLSYEVRIAAPPTTVWAYWTDPERLVRWMGEVATLDPRPGGSFRLDYGSGDVAIGQYLEVDAPSRLVLSWGWERPDDPVGPGASRVEVTLEPTEGGAGTLLRLRHSGLPEGSRASHDEGWTFFLGKLVEATR